MRIAIIMATCLLSPFTGSWAQVAHHSVTIHTADGKAHSYSTEQVDSVTFGTEAAVQHDRWHHMLENPGVADYLRSFEYDATDYSYHRLFDFRGEPYLDARQDWPYGVTLGDTTYYNLIPGQTYSLAPLHDGELQPAIRIQTLGQLRMIRAQGIDNVRDLGGWPTSLGTMLRYGRLYRGTELNTLSQPSASQRSAHSITEADRQLLLHELGIGAELDLRSDAENPTPAHSALGPEVEYHHISITHTDITKPQNQAKLVACLRYLNEHLTAGRNVYIHCIWGADRTGILCLLLEGLLGVCQSDLDKDYELTSFCGNTRYRTNTHYLSALHAVLATPATTLQQQFYQWWLNAGATQADLDLFISLMCL